jgi:hypothetical protein
MYETLLFLHVLAAAALFGTIVAFSAVAFGATVDRRSIAIANVLWGGALILTLILGLALAIDYEAYELWDLLIIATVLAGLAVRRAGRSGAEAPSTGVRIATGLVAFALAAYVVALWAMTTKPD